MEDVALYKVNNNKPIEDITREEIIIGKAIQSANKVGLDKQTLFTALTLIKASAEEAK
ncbi:hypothetical protein HWV01_17640 [Moritella sp. 5]|uniref:hypothetical protein n=1 Tax=Moritella sp. 5 TaxID=2746231 RepID=UPI001BA516EB|nr:hypothetical protein [Moritella sp. 5]QUM81972.1 hypothetical protein HWV01_17640 [Moritella sp. 5]